MRFGLQGDSGASLFLNMDVRIGSNGGWVGGPPTLDVSFAERGKWLRIGCRLRQKNSNLAFSDSNDFNNLAN